MQQNKKILFVATEPASGMVPFASAIINSFYEAEYEVYAFTISSQECSYKESINKNVSLLDINYPNSILGKLKHKFFPFSIYKIINNTAKEHHISNIHFLTGEYGLALHWTKKINRKYNLIYTVHDLEKHPISSKELIKEFKTKCFDKLFYTLTLKNIRIIKNLVTSSKRQYDILKKKYPTKNILYHNFPSLITPKIKEGNLICTELEGEQNYILFFGTFVGYKGVDLLYNAFLNSNICNKYKLVLAGKGSWFFKREKVEKNIIRIDRYILDEEIAALYKNASIVVYPYRQATQSGVISIAHYFRKKIIASDLPYFKDNISSEDILFQAGNEIELTLILEQEIGNTRHKYIKENNQADIVTELSPIYRL